MEGISSWLASRLTNRVKQEDLTHEYASEIVGKYSASPQLIDDSPVKSSLKYTSQQSSNSLFPSEKLLSSSKSSIPRFIPNESRSSRISATHQVIVIDDEDDDFEAKVISRPINSKKMESNIDKKRKSMDKKKIESSSSVEIKRNGITEMKFGHSPIQRRDGLQNSSPSQTKRKESDQISSSPIIAVQTKGKKSDQFSSVKSRAVHDDSSSPIIEYKRKAFNANKFILDDDDEDEPLKLNQRAKKFSSSSSIDFKRKDPIKKQNQIVSKLSSSSSPQTTNTLEKKKPRISNWTLQDSPNRISLPRNNTSIIPKTSVPIDLTLSDPVDSNPFKPTKSIVKKSSVKNMFDSPVKETFDGVDDYERFDDNIDNVNIQELQQDEEEEEFGFVNLNNDPNAKAKFNQYTAITEAGGGNGWKNQKPTVKDFKPKSKWKKSWKRGGKKGK